MSLNMWNLKVMNLYEYNMMAVGDSYYGWTWIRAHLKFPLCLKQILLSVKQSKLSSENIYIMLALLT